MPKYTFPVLLLSMGYPDQNRRAFCTPQHPASRITTRRPIPDRGVGGIRSEMNNYYDLRNAKSARKTPLATNQVVTKMTHPDSRRALLLEDIKQPGFLASGARKRTKTRCALVVTVGR